MNYTPQTGQRQATLPTTVMGAVLTLFIGLAPASLPAVDKLFLKSGETLEASVLEFADGKLTVKLPSGEKHEGLLSEIQKIEFELGTAEIDDQIQLKNGQTLSCAMVSYENGMLSIRLPNGQKQTGNIQEIQSMKVTPAEAKASFADLVEKKLEEQGQPEASPQPTPEPRSSRSRADDRKPIRITGRAQELPRLKLKVSRDKDQDRQRYYYYTIKQDMVIMNVALENTDFSRVLEEGRGYVYAFLRDVGNSRQYQVLSRESFDFPRLEPGDTFQWSGDPARTGTYYEGYYASGYEYHGWLCILLNGNDEIVGIAASKEGWERKAEEAASLKTGDYFRYPFEYTPL